MESFFLRVEGDSLQMVCFRVKVWVTYIVFLSNGIFCSQSRGQLSFFSKNTIIDKHNSSKPEPQMCCSVIKKIKHFINIMSVSE